MKHTQFKALLIALIAISCSTPKEEWNDETRTYTNEEYGISLLLPDDEWEIAVGEGLPENILFCGVIPQKEICTILCKFDEKVYSENIWSDNGDAVSRIIDEATAQEDASVIYSTPRIDMSTINSINYLEFSRILRFPINESDTMSVMYNGILTISDSQIIGLINTFDENEAKYSDVSDAIFSGLKLSTVH